MKNSVETLGVFLLGTAVGAALGILFAPEAGEETRSAILETGRNSWDTVKEKVKAGEEEFDQFKDEAKDKAADLKDEAKGKFDAYKSEAKDKAQDLKGKAEDLKSDAKSEFKDQANDLNNKIQQS